MEIVKILDGMPPIKFISIFLAGSTNRKRIHGDVETWRTTAIELLEKDGFSGIIYDPTWPEEDPSDSDRGLYIEWETQAMKSADYILFWVDAADKESGSDLAAGAVIGEYFRSGKVLIGGSENLRGIKYLKNRCELEGIPYCNSLQSMVGRVSHLVNSKINKLSSTWFTSDTHFGQERTMLLSKRGYKTVEDMDADLISKWNSCVSPSDTVFHLGDFGAADRVSSIMRQLRGYRIYIVPGNYDDDKVLQELKKDSRVTILPVGSIIDIEGIPTRLVHKPDDIKGDLFHLFGHIHRLQMVKTNALNVGTDAHNFTPIDIPTMLFYYLAIRDKYDSNVFCDGRNSCCSNNNCGGPVDG